MKKLHLSKILTVAFFVLLFAVVLTVSVSAAEIKAEDYADLPTAIGNAAAGDTVVVSQDYTLSGPLNITKALTIKGTGTITAPWTVFNVQTGDAFVLEGNVKYVSQNGCGISINNTAAGANITFKDSVSFTTQNNCVQDSTSVSGTVSLTVEGASLTSTGGDCFNFTYGSTCAVAIEVDGGALNATAAGKCCVNVPKATNINVTVSGGNLTSASHVITLDGGANFSAPNITGTMKVTVAGGTLTSTSAHGVNLKNSKGITTLIISGGTINAKNMGVVLNGVVNGSVATISGGTLKATDNHIIHIGNTGAGNTVSVNVTGGSWQPKSQCINNDSVASGATNVKVNVNVSGGTFNTSQYLVRNGAAAAAVTANITGGNITVAGLTTGTVTKTTALATYTNADGKTVYADLATAVANVPAGGTITVNDELTLSKKINVTKSMTITGTGKVSSTTHLFEITGANVELTLGGSVAYTTTGGRGIYLSAANPTIKFNDNVTLSTSAHCIESTGNFSGTATVKATATGNTFTTSGGSCFCFNSGAGSVSVEIGNGTFISEKANVFMVNNANKPDATFTITGGSLQSKGAVFNLSNVGTTTIQGVTYTTADGKNACVASLATAIANVNENGTVTVYGAHTASSFSIEKGMTITGTGTVTTSNTLFNVRVGAAGDTIIFAGSVKYECTGGSGICFSVQAGNVTLKFGGTTEWKSKGDFMWDGAKTETGCITSTTTTNIFVEGATINAGGKAFRFYNAVGNVALNVTGGNISAKTQIGSFESKVTNVDVTVTNGVLTSGESCFYFGNSGDSEAAITGGTFTAPVLFNTNNKFVGSIADAVTLNVDYIIHGATYVSEGKTVYATLPVAVANVVEKGTVTVIGNPSVTSLVIGHSLTIMGEGTVTASGDVFVMNTAGVEITLGGNVTYKTEGGEGISIEANGITVNLYDSVVFNTSGSFMKDAATVTASTTTVNVFGGTYTAGGHVFEFSQGTGAVTLEIANGTFTSTANCAICITKAGVVSVTIRNGKFTGNNHAINIEGGGNFAVPSNISGTVALTILDGEFTGKTIHAINLKYAAEAMTVNVSGGTFIGSNMGIVLNALADGSTFTVSGDSSFTANGNHIFHIANTQSGDTVNVNVAGGAFDANKIFFNVEPNAGKTVVSVTGGTVEAGTSFVCATTAALEMTMSGGTVETCTNGFELKNAASGSVTVSDAASITATANVFSVTNGYQAQLNIAGGSLTAPVLFHTDYEIVPEISTSATIDVDYMIHGATYVNADSKTVYATFQTALNNVTEGKTVTVVGHVTGESFVIAKGMTIDGTYSVTTNNTLFNIRVGAAGDTIIFAGSVKYECTGGSGICFSVQAGNVTLKFGGTTEWKSKGDFMWDGFKDEEGGITNATTTNVFVEGAKINAGGIGFRFYNANGSFSMNVSGGEVNAVGNIARFESVVTNVAITVSGGKLVSNTHGIHFEHSGTTALTISGGTFEAGGHNFDFKAIAGDLELTVPGNPAFARSGASTFCFNGFDGDITANISGGTWTPTGADCFYFLNTCEGDVAMTISNGTFQPKNQVLNLGGNTGKVEITVSGGQFTPNTSNCFHFGTCADVTLDITGGTFNVSDKTFVNVSNSAVKVTMTGGMVTSCGNAFNAYTAPATTVDGTSHFVAAVSGVEIDASAFVFSVTSGVIADITVSGGSYTAPVFFNTDATITPVISDTAEIDVDYMINGATFTDAEGNTVYADLAVAVNAVAAGGTVTVQGNPTVTNSIRVRQDVVIDGAGTVTSTTTIFNVESSAVLTLTGSVVYKTANANVGFSIGADNVTVNFKGDIVFHTKGTFFQDSKHLTAEGTTTVNVYSGTFNSDGYGFYFGIDFDKGNEGNTVLNIEGGTFNTDKSVIYFANYPGNANISIRDGIFNANGSVDYDCIKLYDADNEKTMVCNIYGGVFLVKNARYTVNVFSNNNAIAAENAPNVNIYGGYFTNNQNACVLATKGGVANLYGGYFHFLGGNNVFGGPVFSGSGSDKGTVNVFGGNYVSKGSGVAFRTNTADSVLNLVGSFNAIGGGALISNKNTTAGTPSTGYPVGKELYNASIYMTDGAGIRLVEGSNGLRFVGVITAEALSYINTIAEAGSVSFGTLIAPADLVAQADSFTADGLTRAGVKFVDLPAKDGLVARAGGGYYIRAAIVNIREENLSREFAAVSYVKYTVNGEEVVIYASYRETKNARAIDQVARMALKDEGIYTEAQLNVLRAYAPTTEAPVIDFYLIAGQSNAAGSTNFQSDFANSNPNFKNGYSNVYYSGFSMSGSGIANKMVHSAVPVKIGYGNSLTNFGPELGLADALSSHYNEESGKYAAIIKYAYSGINLYDTVAAPCDAEGNWCPPSWLAEHGMTDPERSGQHYRSFVNYIAECVSDYEAMGYDVNIVTAYWMQGEQDVGRHAKTGEYDDLLTCFINDLRNDVAGLMGDEKYLELPFMIGELSTYLSEPSNDSTHFTNTAGLIAAQHQVAAALSNVWVLNQSNIPSFDIEPGENASNKDRYHWIAENMLWIGQQLGYTVLEEILEVEVSFADEDIVAEVYLNDDLIGSYKSLVGAISNAPEGAVIKLTKDVTLYSTLVIGNTNAITIDGCGNTLNIVVPAKINTGSNDDNLNCGAFRLYATDLTVQNLNVTLNANINESVKGVYTLFGAKAVWNDCTFTQGDNATNNFATVTEDIACSFVWSDIITEA